MLQPKVIEVSGDTPEEVVQNLRDQGVPEELIQAILGRIAEEVEDDSEEEECDCTECTGCEEPELTREEAGKMAGTLLAKLLNEMKDTLGLDFDTQEVMASMGFVKEEQVVEKPKMSVEDFNKLELLKKLKPVIQEISEARGIPPMAVAVGALDFALAVQKHGIEL